MSTTAEERRQRILANAESRLAKVREANRNDKPSDIAPMAPVSSPAPKGLLKKSDNERTPSTTPVVTNNSSLITTFFSSITSVQNMINTLTSSAKSKIPPEITKETLIIDKQHLLILLLGIFVSLLYAFYLSSQSNFFFLVYFTSLICILTSRYYLMQMKHRSNILITTAMLSGFRPDLMKTLILIYTLVCDAWVIFAFYFVSFCFTHVICALF